ncbi:MAG: pyridoxamine 5'-phosphate oxidase family protein [Rhodospirillaceae bacterium]|nr:pyridoxamine 5'-phosphate oxidase family protein [Rhodospirillales bacterium]
MDDKFWRLIHDIPVTMLTTEDADGTLRSRPMVAHQTQFDGDLWLFTRAGSPKTDEVARHHQVNLSFTEPARQTYVSVSGWAELVRDGGKIRQLWSDALSKWFPRGPDDPDLALLRVRVEHAECWDSTASAMIQAYSAAKAGGDPGSADKPGRTSIH